ncbi:MAG TPA: hypothetical protein VFO73_06235 [Candidatus Limnocylindrales bacterium]|nr:hypothetical protein [Candidatus Limnocylindrales bacterium]
MTATVQSPARPLATPRTARFVLAFVAATAAVVALVVAGITFFALAIAFPIAAPLAEQFNLPVDPNDVAIARQFASMWWLFAAASVASFVAALATIVEVIRRVSPVDPE